MTIPKRIKLNQYIERNLFNIAAHCCGTEWTTIWFQQGLNMKGEACISLVAWVKHT